MSAKSFNLDQPKILSFGKELKCVKKDVEQGEVACYCQVL